ncbi:MAG TPA: DUF1702 family protein [Plasticicumulans sp.]|uniref:DUF1702 family protein n=1 Tax=Plasticicumulans sp. TaxID=2307179 RepID=UPI002BF39819|nr:DUF1702 family protein [Plasticicumulans sp.]HNG50340.1 DUF1702 family protein [Plasticicumulans sp.]
MARSAGPACALLGIGREAASFERRGFLPAPPAVQQRLEGIGRTFIDGYRAALSAASAEALAAQLDAEIPLAGRGFAYEGAGMGLALLDLLLPWTASRLQAFLAGPALAHCYIVHVGAGWALARLPWGEGYRRRLDPLLGWLAYDGWGFHRGYFGGGRIPAAYPARLGMAARRVHDQGLGRSLWFVCGADPWRVAMAVAGLDAGRHADLWAGVGLAATYAGGAGDAALAELRRLAGAHAGWLAQGAAFAAKARLHAGNPTADTERGCRALCGCDAVTAAAATDRALQALPADGPEPAYALWRHRIHALLRPRSEEPVPC